MLVLIVWAVAGVLALCGAAVYAELGVMMPRVGGEYVYLSRAYGPAMGFLSGWVALIVGFAAPTAAGAIGFATYVHAVAPALPEKPLAVGLVVLLTAVHMASVRFGARLQSALSAAVVVFIVLFIAAAFTVGHGDWGHLTTAAATVRAPRQRRRWRRARGRRGRQPRSGVVRLFGMERRRLHRRRGSRPRARAARAPCCCRPGW